MEKTSIYQFCSNQVYSYTHDQLVAQLLEGVLSFNTPAGIVTVAATLWQHLPQRSDSLTHIHRPGNGRLCWASFCRLPSLRSYPGLAEACCCHLSQATLEDMDAEQRQEQNNISQFLSKFGKEYARHGAATLCLCHDLWKCSWAINQICSAGSAAFWKQ